jgi:1-acyl-sn-glycerol-3-phosphate acyltransferase
MALTGPWVRLEEPERAGRLADPALWAFSHDNALESVLVPTRLVFARRGRRIAFLVDWMFLHLPLVGRVLRMTGPIPVYRKPDRWRLFETYRRRRLARSEPIAEAVAALAEGRSVGLFPEGTRNGDPDRLLPARPGLGRLVLAAPEGTPVVPVGIEHLAARRGGRRGRVPLFGPMAIRLGEPLDFETERRRGAELAARLAAAPAADRPALRRQIRALEGEIGRRVMAAIAPLAGKTVRRNTPSTSQPEGDDP